MQPQRSRLRLEPHGVVARSPGPRGSALPSLPCRPVRVEYSVCLLCVVVASERQIHTEQAEDRKSTRLNSSHSQISYAVFCLKKKKNTTLPSTSSNHPPSVTSSRV